MDSDLLSLALRQTRLSFLPIPGTSGYGYGLSVRTDEDQDWRAVSAADNCLIRGDTFNLHPSQVRQRDDTTIEFRGKRQGRAEFNYTGTVRADPLKNWLRKRRALLNVV